MSYEQDPRNIFVNQRQGYSEQQSKQQSTQTNTYTEKPSGQQGHTSQTSQQDEYTKRVEEMKRLAVKYEREGEGQLVKDIVNNVIEQKARGQLTNEQLITFAKRVSPLLNSEQRSRLEGLLQELLKL